MASDKIPFNGMDGMADVDPIWGPASFEHDQDLLCWSWSHAPDDAWDGDARDGAQSLLALAPPPLLPLPFFHCFPLCFCSTKKEQKEIKIEQVHAAAGERIDFRHRGAPPPPPPPPTAPRGVPTPLGFLAVLAVDPYRLLFLFKPSRTTLSHHLLIAGT